MEAEKAPSGSIERSSTTAVVPGMGTCRWPITSMVPNHSWASAV